MKKQLMAGMMAASMALSLAACGGSAASSAAPAADSTSGAASTSTAASTSSDEQVTLRFAWWGGDERANADVQHDGKEQKLIIRALCFFNLTRAELLADDNGNGVAHGEHDDAEEVPYCAGNVRGGDDGQTARGVALADHRGADTPEELVKHERRAGEEDLFHDGTGQIQAFI